MESLYRKYRPQTFADVVGQRHVVSTLERAVTEGRTSHAYLFCGPRGTGKTTMARILAKALMCERGAGQLPDGTCEECRLIAAGEHPDVYELDAASRTGVDNVREEIISRVDYAPVRGRAKVYIIDEVHMLTPAAFNALLKTLEEPPAHVVFIMCTTDPQKVLPTILSRVQRFDFRPIGAEEMRDHLADLCGREGFDYEDEALDLVVRHAHGGMRDAISTLEQLSVFGGGSITAVNARDLLGEVADSRVATMSRALAARDMSVVFGEVASLVNGGGDPLQFTRDLMAHVRNVYVACVAGEAPGALDATPDEAAQLAEEARAYGGPERLSRVLGVLDDVAVEMRTATNQRLTLEVALTRLARPESDLTLEALAERVEALEARLANGAPVVPVAAPKPGAAPAPAAAAAPAPEAVKPAFVPPPLPGREKPKAPSARSAAPTGSAQAHERVSGAGATKPAFVPPPLPGRERPSAPSKAPRPVAAPATGASSANGAVPAAAPAPEPVSAPAPRPAAPAPAESASQPAASASQPVTNGNLQRTWKSVVDGLLKVNASYGSILLSATAQSDDGSTLTVALPAGSSFARLMLARPDVKAAVEAAVSATFGPRTLSYVEGSGVAKASAPAVQSSPAAVGAATAAPVTPSSGAPKSSASSPTPVPLAPKPPAPAPSVSGPAPVTPASMDSAPLAAISASVAPAPAAPVSAVPASRESGLKTPAAEVFSPGEQSRASEPTYAEEPPYDDIPPYDDSDAYDPDGEYEPQVDASSGESLQVTAPPLTVSATMEAGLAERAPVSAEEPLVEAAPIPADDIVSMFSDVFGRQTKVTVMDGEQDG